MHHCAKLLALMGLQWRSEARWYASNCAIPAKGILWISLSASCRNLAFWVLPILTTQITSSLPKSATKTIATLQKKFSRAWLAKQTKAEATASLSLARSRTTILWWGTATVVMSGILSSERYGGSSLLALSHVSSQKQQKKQRNKREKSIKKSAPLSHQTYCKRMMTRWMV